MSKGSAILRSDLSPAAARDFPERWPEEYLAHARSLGPGNPLLAIGRAREEEGAPDPEGIEDPVGERLLDARAARPGHRDGDGRRRFARGRRATELVGAGEHSHGSMVPAGGGRRLTEPATGPATT